MRLWKVFAIAAVTSAGVGLSAGAGDAQTLPVVRIASTQAPHVVIGCGAFDASPGSVTLSRTDRVGGKLSVAYEISAVLTGTNKSVGAKTSASATFLSNSTKVSVTLPAPHLPSPSLTYDLQLLASPQYRLGDPSTATIVVAVVAVTCPTMTTSTTTTTVAAVSRVVRLPRTGSSSGLVALVGVATVVAGAALWGTSMRATRRQGRWPRR